MTNQSIRIALIQNDVRLYELAAALHVSEATMSRKMREEMPEEEQKRIVNVIDGMKKGEPTLKARRQTND